MDESDELMGMLKTFADGAIEHFDSILILASGPAVDKDGGTVFYRMARGNAHANEGLTREYLRRLETFEGGYHGERGRRERAREEDGFE